MPRYFFLAAVLFIFSRSVHAQQPDYFPMHIGDKWVYQNWSGGFPNGRHSCDQVIEITDTTTINDQRYFVVKDVIIDLVINPGERFEFTHFFRKRENGDVMKFSERADEEQLFYTFQNDSLNRPYLFCSDILYPLKWQITLIDTETVVHIPTGTFPNSLQFFFDIWDSTGNVLPLSIRLLAPDLGLIEEVAEGDDKFLIGAFVNGTLIGDTTVTSIRTIPETRIPITPYLYQNYPNPFNGLTRIRYSVPDFWREAVEINIYDITGRMVYRFDKQEVRGGLFELQWQGQNHSGKEVSSGLYFVKLSSGEFSQVIKVNFLK